MKCNFRAVVLFLLTACLLVGCSRNPEVQKQKYFDSGMRYFDKGQYGEAALQFKNALQADPTFASAHYQLGLTYLKLEQLSRAYQELTAAVDKDPNNLDARLALANLLMRAGKFQDAGDQLAVIGPREPSNPLYHMAQANYYAGVKNLPAALQEMDKAIALDPNRSELFLNLAILQSAAQKPELAEATYKKAISLDPKSVNARMALASFYEMRGQLAEAEQTYHNAMASDPKNPDPPAALVRLLAIEHKGDEAEALARKMKRDMPDNPTAYRMLGDYYFLLANDVDRATAEYESLYKDHPKDPLVRKNYVQLLIFKGRFTDADKLNKEALAANSQDIDGLVNSAQIKIGEGRPTEAVSILQGVLARDPENAIAHYYLGAAFETLGDHSRAENEWRAALTDQPGMLKAQQALATVYQRKGDWNALAQVAADIIKEQPTLPDGYALKANADINLQHPEQARQDIQKAIEVAPQNSIGYVQLGTLEFLQKRYAEAEKAYQKALELGPDSSEALSGLMKVYLAQKDPDKAIAAARAQIAKSPNNSAFYDLLGEALFVNRKDSAGAEAALRKSVALDSGNTDAILKLGQVLMASGSGDQALTLAQQSAKDHPQDVAIQLLLGELYESRKDWSNAKAAYQQALTVQPDHPIASNNLAFIMLEEGGNVDVALQLAQTARRGMPDNANAADTLGWAYYKKGAYVNAIDLFREAVHKSHDDPSFHYHLGLAYQQVGKTTLAREEFQTVLKISPNFSEAEDVRRALSELHG